MTRSSATFTPMVLTVGYLAAFAPHSLNGTIMGPFRGGPGLGGPRSHPVTDGRPALDLIESTQQALADCRRLHSSFAATHHPLPQPLPAPAQGWILNKCFGSRDDFSTGVFCVEQAEGPLGIEADLSEPDRARFGVVLKTKSNKIAQWIAVERRSGIVGTERYQIRMRFVDRPKALSFMGDMSSFLYECGQYEPERELGPLRLRDERGAETDVEKADGRYTLTGKAPELTGHAMLCSALSVLEIPGAGLRQPVISVEIPGEGSSEVTISLYRPPQRPKRLMPLQPRLYAVWEKFLERIVKDGL